MRVAVERPVETDDPSAERFGQRDVDRVIDALALELAGELDYPARSERGCMVSGTASASATAVASWSGDIRPPRHGLPETARDLVIDEGA